MTDMTRHTPELLDAVRQLNAAARRLTKAANTNAHLFDRRAELSNARHAVNAALARMANAQAVLDAE